MLLEKLRKLGLIEHFGIPNGRDFQQSIAPKLREIAVEHLRSGRGQVAEGYRANISATEILTVGHLNQQARNGVWADDIVLAALAEVLDVSFVVNYNSSTMAIRTSPSPVAPIVALQNTSNAAWDFKRSSGASTTVHDGNCGFNSFAESLASVVTPLLQAEQTQAISEQAGLEAKASTVPAKPLLPAEEVKVIQKVQVVEFARYSSIIEETHKTGVEDQVAYAKAYKGFSEEVRAQIDTDHAFALKLVASDLVSNSIFSPRNSFATAARKLPSVASSCAAEVDSFVDRVVSTSPGLA